MLKKVQQSSRHETATRKEELARTLWYVRAAVASPWSAGTGGP